MLSRGSWEWGAELWPFLFFSYRPFQLKYHTSQKLRGTIVQNNNNNNSVLLNVEGLYFNKYKKIQSKEKKRKEKGVHSHSKLPLHKIPVPSPLTQNNSAKKCEIKNRCKNARF